MPALSLNFSFPDYHHNGLAHLVSEFDSGKLIEKADLCLGQVAQQVTGRCVSGREASSERACEIRLFNKC